MKNIVVLVGSVRAESINLKFAKALQKIAQSRFTFFYAAISELPFYNDDLWKEPPAAVLELKRRVEAADAVLFVTPEYNRSIPGVLKNAIDWGSRPWGKSSWTGKPCAIVGTTGGVVGTAVAQAQLRTIVPVLDMVLLGQPEVYFRTMPG
ncbi:MAG TPA: NADPH-dependent FMN reductase, partial [Casimicrobiaceae bacterium]